MRTTTEDYLLNLRKVVDDFQLIDGQIRSRISPDTRRIILVGSGANYSQMIPARHLVLGLDGEVDCHLYIGGELERRIPPMVNQHAVVIGMSHSGNTPEIQLALEQARSRGAIVFGISSSSESKIARAAGFHYAYPAGSNISEMKLLTLTAMLLSILDVAGAERTEQVKGYLTELPQYLCSAYKRYEPLARDFAGKFGACQMMYSVGCGAALGPSYAFAISKLMEMQWKDAACLDSSEFFHGPLEIADRDRVFVLWAAGDAMSRQTYRLHDYLSGKESGVHFIETESVYPVKSTLAQEFLSPFLLWPALNVHAWALEEVTGHNLDLRRNMGKEDTKYKWAQH